jgi:hypothetical protein
VTPIGHSIIDHVFTFILKKGLEIHVKIMSVKKSDDAVCQLQDERALST